MNMLGVIKKAAGMSAAGFDAMRQSPGIRQVDQAVRSVGKEVSSSPLGVMVGEGLEAVGAMAAGKPMKPSRFAESFTDALVKASPIDPKTGQIDPQKVMAAAMLFEGSVYSPEQMKSFDATKAGFDSDSKKLWDEGMKMFSEGKADGAKTAFGSVIEGFGLARNKSIELAERLIEMLGKQ